MSMNDRTDEDRIDDYCDAFATWVADGEHPHAIEVLLRWAFQVRDRMEATR